MKAFVCCLAVAAACVSTASAQSWQQVFPRFSVKDISSVVHWRGDTIFAAGSDWTLLRSTDNGRTWRNMFTDYCGRSITRMQSDGRWLWFATQSVSPDTYGEYMDTTQVFLYRYDVAANDTLRVPVPVFHPRKYGISIGLSVSRDCITVLQNGARLTVVQSTDGGATWDHRALPDSFTFAGDIRFLDRDHGWVVAKSPSVSNGMAAYVTHDAGSTWTQIADIFYPTSLGLYDNIFTTYPGGWFHDSLGVLVTNGTQVCTTTDTGRTWRRSQPLPVFIRSVSVDSANVCVVATEGLGAYASADGGATWTSIRSKNAASVYQYPVIVSARPGTCVVGSRNGFIV
jgi:hypothetical protein